MPVFLSSQHKLCRRKEKPRIQCIARSHKNKELIDTSFFPFVIIAAVEFSLSEFNRNGMIAIRDFNSAMIFGFCDSSIF